MNQTIEYELILIDNSKNEFVSAAQSLNMGGKRATGDILMFVHQDIWFGNSNTLEEILKNISLIPKNSIAGIAGKSIRDRGCVSNTTHGKDKEVAGKIKIDCPTRVQTIDECMLIVTKVVFNKIKFDEKVCQNWHLYGVEYCLQVAEYGLKCFVLPVQIHHKSEGRINPQYYHTLSKVIQKHRKRNIFIFTTVGDWCTVLPVTLQAQTRIINRVFLKIYKFYLIFTRRI